MDTESQVISQVALRVLLLEDSPLDAELTEHALRKEHKALEIQRVDSQDGFVAALEKFSPNICLLDYKLPSFDGESALKLLRKSAPDIPAIMVTGAVGDEKAIELLRLGAQDYVLKENLPRLGPAVKRVLEEEADRRARREAERNLLLFRALLDHSSDSVEVLDPETLEFIDCNATCCESVGYTRDEILSMSIHDIDPDAGQIKGDVAKALFRGKPVRFESRHWRKDGSTFPVEVSAQRIELDRPYLLAIARDISERREAERLLAERETWHRSLIENLTDMVVVLDAGGVFRYISPAVKELGGYEPEELIGTNYVDLVHPDDLANSAERIRVLLENPDKPQRGHMRLRHKNGEWRMVETVDQNLLEVPGVNGIVVTSHDVTERMMAAAALEESERRFRAILEDIRLVALMLDMEGRVTFCNDYLLQLTGWDREQVVGQDWFDRFIPAESRDEVRAVHRSMQVGDMHAQHHDNEILTRSGERRLIRWNNTGLRGDQDVVTGIASIGEDITEQQRAENELRKSEAQLREAQELARMGSWEMDLHSEEFIWSDGIYRIAEIEPDQANQVHESFLELVHPDDRERVSQAFLEALEDRRSYTVDYRQAMPDGRIKYMSLRGEILCDAEGKPRRALGTVQDISELKTTALALTERVKEQRCLFRIASLTNRPGLSEEVLLSGALQPIVDGFQFPELTQVQIRLGDQVFATPQFAPVESIRVDLQAAGEIEGSIEVGYSQPCPVADEGSFLKEERALMETVAGILERALGEIRDQVALARLTRALRTLSAGNSAVIYATSEQQLYADMCEAAVTAGAYRMAWVGLVQDDPEKTVKPVAWAGEGIDYLKKSHISWGDNEFGRGPTGTSIRTGKAQIARDISTDSWMKPWREEALTHGFRSSISLPLWERDKIIGALMIYAPDPNAFDDEEQTLLEEMTADLSYGVTALHDRQAHELTQARLSQAMEATVNAIAATVEKRDPYTAGHQKRVARLSVALGQELGLSEEQLRGLSLAASIHDLGKMSVPAEILSRPSKLIDVEFNLVKSHAQVGYDILKDVNFPWPIAEMVWQHHERLDGSGYPRGIRGEDILLEARIIAVADVMEAMSSHRPYRPSLGIDAAMEQLITDRGDKLDADVVDACVHLFRDKGFSLESIED